MKEFIPSQEQQRIFDFDKRRMLISASAGSGKTTTMIEYITRLLQNGQNVQRIGVLTFTKAAASEMKERLLSRLVASGGMQQQIDDLLTCDISTIHAFLERLLRRNISQFPYLEGFKILDESESSIIKSSAFEEATVEMKEQDKNAYYNLFLTMRDKKSIENAIYALDNFLSAQADREKILDEFGNYKNVHAQAKEYLINKILLQRQQIIDEIDTFPKDNAKAEAYLAEIRGILATDDSGRDLVARLAFASLSRQPSLNGYDKKTDIVDIKLRMQALIKFCKKLSPEEDFVWDATAGETLNSQFLSLYKIFKKIYNNKKLNLGVLDFDDLEQKSEALLNEVDLLSEVQDKYDYFFIDEYQDTNPVQEKIVKLLSNKGRFIAIGDPKQGIYGFRNATSKIILADSHDFSEDSQSTVEYLSQNYRSDKRILKFVNHVFAKIMTNSTSGIDYKKTAMLKGDKNTKTLGSAVEILVADKQRFQKEESASEYDIFLDPLLPEDGASLEADMVMAKLDSLLASFFVDPETGERTRVKPSDIAILSRSRGGVSQSIINRLIERGIPFVSTMRTDLAEKSCTALIKSLLSLCINENDDISLAAYLFSPLCGISSEKLAILAQEKKPFNCIILESQDEEIVACIKRLELFKRQAFFLGARAALEKLFIEKHYFAYLHASAGRNAVAEMQSILSIIGGYQNDKDIPSLIEYLSCDISFSSVSGSGAITISSIHASKGLEYPIVILVGTGKSLSHPISSGYKIGSMGVGLMAYDSKRWLKAPSLPLIALREMSALQERIDEIMVLYVALTRAKSHLVITGSLDATKVEDFSEEKFNKFSSALLLILSTNPQESGADIKYISEVEKLSFSHKKVSNFSVNDKTKEAIESYVKFAYPFEKQTKTLQKTSVTALASMSADEQKIEKNQAFIDEGIAYHEALKLVDFETAKTVADIENQLKLKKINENWLKIIDFNLIIKNIQIIYPLIKDKKIFKEKQFTMRTNVDGAKVLVQGVVDLFAIGQKNILIDYKYTNINDEKILKERYYSQLNLYKYALEKSQNINIDEIYLISLKKGKIIKF